MKKTFSPTELLIIDEALNLSVDGGTHDYLGLMVDLWQNRITPENLGWVGNYVNPQFEESIKTNNRLMYSVWYTNRLIQFKQDFIFPFFEKTYPLFFDFMTENHEFWNANYVNNYFGWRQGIIEDFWNSMGDRPYSFLPLKHHTAHFKCYPSLDPRGFEQYLNETVEHGQFTEEQLETLRTPEGWEEYCKTLN